MRPEGNILVSFQQSLTHSAVVQVDSPDNHTTLQYFNLYFLHILYVTYISTAVGHVDPDHGQQTTLQYIHIWSDILQGGLLVRVHLAIYYFNVDPEMIYCGPWPADHFAEYRRVWSETVLDLNLQDTVWIDVTAASATWQWTASKIEYIYSIFIFI